MGCIAQAYTDKQKDQRVSMSTDDMEHEAKIYCSMNSKRRPKPNSQTEDEKKSESENVLPDKWCIYRVPSKLRNVNKAAYTPQLLSIGPFHHNSTPELKNMEEDKRIYYSNMEVHKKIYFEKFCVRSPKSEVELSDFIKNRKDDIRGCYAGTIEPEIESALVGIIVVDACFIIELFLRNSETESDHHKNDYILRSPWLRKAIEQDLMLFENQLPYSLLQDLYDFAIPSSSSTVRPSQGQAQEHSIDIKDPDPCFQHCFPCSRPQAKDKAEAKAEAVQDPFLKVTCDFFGDYSKGKSVKKGVKPKHFTDLVRHFLCPEEKLPFEYHSLGPPKGAHTKNIYSVKQLRAAGVKFRPLKKHDHAGLKKDDHADHAGFFIKLGDNKFSLACFRNMYLNLTPFHVLDETECILRNVMALEQFLYPNEAYICNYFLMMDELVDTREDVNFLVENKVIINWLGSNKAVAKLLNSLCENIMEDKSCYVNVGKKLNEHYENFWNRHVATLRQVYFKDLWTSSATIVGICVVLLSITISLRTIILGHKLYFRK